MSKLDKIIASYRKHIGAPWQSGLAAIQRVIFVVYDKGDELRLRANVEEFRQATVEAKKHWMPIDVTDKFPMWMVSKEFRDEYFSCPEDLTGYQTGEVQDFVSMLIADLKQQIQQSADAETVVAILGVGSLFGLARVSKVVDGIKDVVPGRLLVFFPGEYHPENHSYRLLDARDGWDYLAVPILATE